MLSTLLCLCHFHIFSDFCAYIIVFCSCEYPQKWNDSPFHILYENKVENRFAILFRYFFFNFLIEILDILFAFQLIPLYSLFISDPSFHTYYGNIVWENRLAVLFMTELNGSVEAWSLVWLAELLHQEELRRCPPQPLEGRHRDFPHWEARQFLQKGVATWELPAPGGVTPLSPTKSRGTP